MQLDLAKCGTTSVIAQELAYACVCAIFGEARNHPHKTSIGEMNVRDSPERGGEGTLSGSVEPFS